MLSIIFVCIVLVVNCEAVLKLSYSWQANLTSGSLLPTEHLTNYEIGGRIALYYITEHEILFQLEDIWTSNLNYVPEYLSLTFLLNQTSSINQFASDQGDEPWSANIKRSLASLFNLRTDQLTAGSLVSQEETLYGQCHVECITLKTENGFIVKKILNELSCQGSPKRYQSNTPFFKCPSTYQESSSSSNERTYVLSDTADRRIITEITSLGAIHFQPFQAVGEAHYISVSQVAKFISLNLNSSLIEKPESLLPSSLTYVTEFDQEPIMIRIKDKNKLKEEVDQLLQIMTESLNWELSTKHLDNETAFQILELMIRFSVEHWESLYKNIMLGTSYSQETIRHFFWDLLPQVGTEAAGTFILSLVTSHRATGDIATELLSTFPMHIKQVNEKFLTYSEVLLSLTSVDTAIKHQGLLAFATLISRTCTNVKCTLELTERYTKFYLDKFMENDDDFERLIHLQCLNNLRLERILDFLKPVITDSVYSKHVRYTAMWTAFPAASKYPDKVSEIFWPLFMNRTEPLEIRLGSFAILLMVQPAVYRLLTFYWYMQNEPNEQLYHFFYTTVHSFANTKYPCYSHMRRASSQLSRYLTPKSYRWYNGYRMLDYEDPARGYGGYIQTFAINSEITGLPSNLFFSTEQHSHGITSKFSVSLKLEGVLLRIYHFVWKEIIGNFTDVDKTFINELIRKMNYTIKDPEEVHFEMVVKIDGYTVYCQYYNETSLTAIATAVKKVSSLYYDFSVNYQRIRFPLRYESNGFTDLGTPVMLQVLTSSLLSIRGSLKQVDNGRIRNAELDLRYSMDTMTSLQTYNPFDKDWYGARRTRSLHMRIPFNTNLTVVNVQSHFQVTANRHKDFVDGSILGLVWHSTVKVYPSDLQIEDIPKSTHKDIQQTTNWSVESRDLGARFETKIFDCDGDSDISALFSIVKEAFHVANKNYKMVACGAPILGLVSLSNYFTYLPLGASCGIMASMSPLQLQLILLNEGKQTNLKMIEKEPSNVVWEIHLRTQEDDDGSKKYSFHLDHSLREQNISALNSWRIKIFEGFLKLPSYKAGILSAPAPVDGKAQISWGDPNSSSKIEVKVDTLDSAKNYWPENCNNDTATCLKIAMNLATQQKIIINCTDVPMWLTTALLSLFPDNVEAEKHTTLVQFYAPTNFLWTSESICAINSKTYLDFDYGEIKYYPQRTDCYSAAVVDCVTSSFVVSLRKSTVVHDYLELKIAHSGSANLEIVANIDDTLTVQHKITFGNITLDFSKNGRYKQLPVQSTEANFSFRIKYWETPKMVEVIVGQTGLTVQHYGYTMVAIASYKLRGKTCGMCGDYNGEASNDLSASLACISL